MPLAPFLAALPPPAAALLPPPEMRREDSVGDAMSWSKPRPTMSPSPAACPSVQVRPAPAELGAEEDAALLRRALFLRRGTSASSGAASSCCCDDDAGCWSNEYDDRAALSGAAEKSSGPNPCCGC